MRGGYGSSSHGSLEERIARSASAPATTPADPPSPARHCLVDGQPSLLVEWRRTDAGEGWEGRVVSVLWLEGQGWATVERWLPAVAIRAV